MPAYQWHTCTLGITKYFLERLSEYIFGNPITAEEAQSTVSTAYNAPTATTARACTIPSTAKEKPVQFTVSTATQTAEGGTYHPLRP
jgi:hypothetical protein